MKLWCNNLVVIVYSTFFALLMVGDAAANDKTLTGLLENNRNIEGQFHQITYDEDGAERQQSRGEFVLAQPNRFVWNTLEPFPQRIISDGDTIIIWDIDLEQATQKSFKKALNNSPAALLSQPANEVLPNYNVEQLDQNRFKLEPLNSEGLFSNLTLVFEKNTIASMKIEDTLGQTTTIDFQKLKHHNGVDESKFQINLPDDVDLIIEGQ